jgi:hypothetical protein
MTMRKVLMGALLFVLGAGAGLLGATGEALAWAAATAVLAWGLWRFLLWRDEWRRHAIAAGRRPDAEHGSTA